MKYRILYTAMLSLTVLAGCSSEETRLPTLAALQPESGTCELMDAATLKLSGPIDDAMRDCATAMLMPDITTVTVTTKGGEVFAGRAIGYKIGEHPRHLIIDEMCLSSCGNYFVPAAAHVSLLPGSVIGLHGTPDPHMLSDADMENHMASLVEDGNVASQGLTRILKRKAERREKQLSEEEMFATHFNVPKGWRHYREAGDADDGWRKHFSDGSDVGVTPDKFMIVEGPMLASCLPHVKTEAYQATLEKTVLRKAKFWASLKDKMGAYRSLGLTCSHTPSPQ